MSISPKVFYSHSTRSRLRRFASSPAFSVLCLTVGLLGFLFGSILITRPLFSGSGCIACKPRSVSVVWEKATGGIGFESGSDNGVVVKERHKVMGFVEIQTGFASTGRRRSLRKTWFPSDREGLTRLEESTGLTFRFVIGKTSDKSKMAALQREIEKYDDFLLLDTEDEYSKLPYKMLAFFKAAYALFASDFYVKADDDIYLRPDRLSLLLAKERSHPQTYIGCMKKGPVFTGPKLKWQILMGRCKLCRVPSPLYGYKVPSLFSIITFNSLRGEFQLVNGYGTYKVAEVLTETNIGRHVNNLQKHLSNEL